MKVKCVYRWMLDGEIIEGLYNTDTGVIDGVSSDMFKLNSNVIKYHEGNYSLYGSVSYEKLHTYINKGTNLYAVIDFDGIGVVQVTRNAALRYLFINEYLSDVEIPEVFTHRMLEIGRAKTIVRQRSVLTKPQIMYYDAADEIVHSYFGELKLTFPVTELEPVTTFDRYMEMTKDVNAVAVVRYNGYNKLLIKEGLTVRKE